MDATKLDIRTKLSWRRPNSGIIKFTLKQEGLGHVREVVKVQAHVEEHSVDDPVLKRHARRNEMADASADLGVWKHPVLARGDTSIEAYARKVTRIAKTIAHTCILWPR